MMKLLERYCFRAKTIDEPISWVIGTAIEFFGKTWIIEIGESVDRMKLVKEETLGISINLKDKDGVPAFVGDIFKDQQGVVRTIFVTEGGFACECNPLSFGYGYQENSNPQESLGDPQTASWFMYNCEIIGNIIDTPELLK